MLKRGLKSPKDFDKAAVALSMAMVPVSIESRAASLTKMVAGYLASGCPEKIEGALLIALADAENRGLLNCIEAMKPGLQNSFAKHILDGGTGASGVTPEDVSGESAFELLLKNAARREGKA